jgi:hypothetical protein
MQRIADSQDADVLWVIKENLKKNRLIKNFPNETAATKKLLPSEYHHVTHAEKRARRIRPMKAKSRRETSHHMTDCSRNPRLIAGSYSVKAETCSVTIRWRLCCRFA